MSRLLQLYRARGHVCVFLQQIFIISAEVMPQPRETRRADCVYFIDRTQKIFWECPQAQAAELVMCLCSLILYVSILSKVIIVILCKVSNHSYQCISLCERFGGNNSFNSKCHYPQIPFPSFTEVQLEMGLTQGTICSSLRHLTSFA